MNTSAIINDPNYVPLASEAGDLLITEDETRFIIVSSTLNYRSTDATALGSKTKWMNREVRYVNGSTSKSK